MNIPTQIRNDIPWRLPNWNIKWLKWDYEGMCKGEIVLNFIFRNRKKKKPFCYYGDDV